MRVLILISILVNLLLTIACQSTKIENTHTDLAIVPKPKTLEMGPGVFTLNKNAGYYVMEQDSALAKAVHLFDAFLESNYQLGLVKKELKEQAVMYLQIDSSYAPESYLLEITPTGIAIKGGDYAGVFYGLQTLQQLIFQQNKANSGSLNLKALKITDAPNFVWRGMHLDVSRHFFEKAEVLKLIDAMAFYKMNVLHWHLTDDQGWRIEIKKYPKLTTEAAWRDETIIGHMAEHPKRFDGKRHGGFFTQEEVKEVIAFAAARGITVMPEIEMPGHAVAVLRSYPQYSCAGGSIPAFNEWGVSDDVFCAGNDATFEFLQGVLDEVIALFPSEYLHIGGDECPKVRWENCSKCQARIKNEGLKDEHELQSYFVKRIEKYVHAKGKKLMGWDEILEGGLPERASVMCWRDDAHAIAAANDGHQVVMTPNPICYLDHYQSEKYEPLAIGGLTHMQKIYNWNILPDGLNPGAETNILGAQVNVWTEYILNNEHLEYMIYPRLIALAENLWIQPEQKNYTDFEQRMVPQYPLLDALQIAYRVPYPMGFDETNITLNQTDTVVLFNGIPGSEIFYTTDGSEPTAQSTRYDKPIVLDLSAPRVLKAITIMPSGRKSAVSAGLFKNVTYQKAVALENPLPGLNFCWQQGEFSDAKTIAINQANWQIVPDISLPSNVPDYFFAAVFKGFIKIETDGIYQFEVNSDDGSALFIHDALVLETPGFNYGSRSTGVFALKAGYHPIRMNYFQAKYGAWIAIKYSINGEEFKDLTPDVLFRNS